MVFALVAAFSFTARSSAAFVHSGALESQRELDFVKAKIAAGLEPWTTQFQRAKNDGMASRTPNGGQPTTVPDGKNMMDDATGAYVQALLWRYTDGYKYATGAVAIINSWSNLQAITGDPTPSQANLAAGWTGAVMAPAAELMRGYSGWGSGDISKVQGMFRRVFYPWVNATS
jgi:hypothetical protein